jgi:ABC-2 type transport system ATP-binding protein
MRLTVDSRQNLPAILEDLARRIPAEERTGPPFCIIRFVTSVTGGLDVPSRVELHDMLRELQAAGTTIVLATHDMAEAEEMADRVAILLRGSIVATGTPLALTATGAGLTKVSVRTTGSSLPDSGITFPAVSQHVLKDRYAIYFSSDIGPTVSAIIAHINAQKDTLIDLRVERPSLEDRFLEITATDGKNRGGAA